MDNDTRAPWVPNRISEKERTAEIRIIRALADELDLPGKANFVATLESIVIRARRLFDEEARFIGRGYKHGENLACQECNGVYKKEAK